MKLNEYEVDILDTASYTYKWIARQNGSEIVVFDKRPVKEGNSWIATGKKSYKLHEMRYLFREMKDGDLYNIEELLAERGEKK